jgi:hypothetical protein
MIAPSPVWCSFKAMASWQSHFFQCDGARADRKHLVQSDVAGSVIWLCPAQFDTRSSRQDVQRVYFDLSRQPAKASDRRALRISRTRSVLRALSFR